MTRISFLIPTFNRARFLGEALGAILSQMGGEDELLVIDDGSNDSTAAVVREAGARVRYVRQENAGKSAALNRGLAETSGEFIWICDDDDVLLPGAVARLSGEVARFKGDVVFGRYRRARLDQGEWVPLGDGYWPELSTGSFLRHVLEDHFIMQNASLVRRGAYYDIGGFSEALLRSIDYDASIRLALSFEMGFVDAELYEQREHDGIRGPAHLQLSSADVTAHWVEADRQIFRNLIDLIPLTLYEAMFEAPRNRRRRAALLQRGVVMARHDCWDLACDDLEKAATMDAGPLDAVEYQICNRALAGKQGVGRLMDSTIRRRLRALRLRSKRGRELVGAILAGGLWRLRGGDLRQASAVMKGLISIAGPSGVATVLAHKVGKSRPATMKERSTLPTDAFLPPGTIARLESKRRS